MQRPKVVIRDFKHRIEAPLGESGIVAVTLDITLQAHRGYDPRLAGAVFTTYLVAQMTEGKAEDGWPLWWVCNPAHNDHYSGQVNIPEGHFALEDQETRISRQWNVNVVWEPSPSYPHVRVAFTRYVDKSEDMAAVVNEARQLARFVHNMPTMLVNDKMVADVLMVYASMAWASMEKLAQRIKALEDKVNDVPDI